MHIRSIRFSSKILLALLVSTQVFGDGGAQKVGSSSRRKKRNRDAELFGSLIRQLRTERGLTQEALAELAEVDVSYFGFIERGENVPTLTIVLNLAEALQVDVSDLVGEISRKR